MDYRRSTNYGLQGQGNLGYADDYRTGFHDGLAQPLISHADPMKAATGPRGQMIGGGKEEEGGCNGCKWCMVVLTIAAIVGVGVAVYLYEHGEASHKPHPSPAHGGGGSHSGTGFDDEDPQLQLSKSPWPWPLHWLQLAAAGLTEG